MVVCEDEQSVLPKDAAAFSKNSAQLRCELLCADVLHLFNVACRASLADKRRRAELLPGKEEVREFGVMDVVEERRVRNDQVYAGISQTG